MAGSSDGRNTLTVNRGIAAIMTKKNKDSQRKKQERARLKAKYLKRFSEIGSEAVVARELDLNRSTAQRWTREAGLRSKRVEDPRKAEYLQLRKNGLTQVAAARQAGINEHTGRDWEKGIKRLANGRLYPDGRRVDYKTKTTTIVDMTIPPVPRPSLAALEQPLPPRFLTLDDREQIADLRRQGLSLRAIGRALG